mgnify:CR=1 FL=1
MQERNSKQEEALFTLLMDQVARQENQQAREAMERLARAEGVFVDTTYNAKVLAGLEDAGRRGIAEGGTLFWHTGGVPSLFG